MKISSLNFLLTVLLLSCSTEGRDRNLEDVSPMDSAQDQNDTPNTNLMTDATSDSADAINTLQESSEDQYHLDSVAVDSVNDASGPRCESFLDCNCENGDPGYCCGNEGLLYQCSLEEGWMAINIQCNEQSFEPYENVACPWSHRWEQP